MKTLFLLFLTSVLCTGCNSDVEKTAKQNTLNLSIIEDPHSLDPRIVRMIRDLSLVKQLFDGLTRIDRNGDPQPAVAEMIEISEDGLTYTFHLRDVKWSNGDPVLASDFVYAWSTVLSPDFPTDYAHMLYPIKNGKLIKEGKCALDSLGARACDDKTLVVQLENPTPYFLELLAFPTSFPVSARVATKDSKWALPPGDRFVSNGPFSIATWMPDNTLVLKKSETYWEKEQVKLDGICLSVIPDNTTESYLYEKGELDWLGQPLSNNISSELLSELKKSGQLNSYSVAGTYWLKYNTGRLPFNDKTIRQAFAYAISREKIISHILRGSQKSAQGVLPPCMSLQSPLFEDENIPLAQKLFKEYLDQKGLTPESFPELS